MRRIGFLTFLAAALWTASLAVSIRASTATLTDQETTTASYGSAACFSNDASGPTIPSSVISKTSPYLPSFIRQAGAYYVYANAPAGSGGPTTRVSADVRGITPGQYIVPLVAGSYSVGGTAYTYRSAALTATSPLAQGAYPYSVSAATASSQCRTASWNVTVDNTAPTATDVQPNNGGGGTTGRPNIADTIVYTFSETIDPETVSVGWTGTSRNVVVRITDSGTNDLLTVWNSANTTQLPMGSVALSQNYVTTNTTWGASGTASTMVQSGATVTITLGTGAGTTVQSTANVAAVWTPVSTPTDRAGNAATTTLATEGGASDRNF